MRKLQKYMTPIPRLFDLKNDPGEMKNLAKSPAYADVLKEHRRYLDEFRRKHGDNFSAPEVSK